jgi:thiol-disulfide isomerase/thioredoxin
MQLKKFPIPDRQMQEFIKLNSTCIFDTADWLNVLQDGLGLDVHYYGLECDGQLVLAISLVKLDFRLVRIAYSNIPYGGFIGNCKYIPDFIPLLENALKDAGTHIFRITKRFSENFKHFNGYKVQHGYQQVIDIEGLTNDLLWQGYRKRTRRDIRRAEKLGVVTIRISKRSELEILYQLYQDTVKRNNTYTTWTKKAFYSIYDILFLNGKADILFAQLKDRYIAGVIIIYSSDTVYYFMSASLTNYLSFCPNDLLLHEVISSGIEKNKQCVDLMTSKDTDLELVKFKEKWGAKCYPFDILGKDIDKFRAVFWDQAWRMGNSRLGGAVIRLLRR